MSHACSECGKPATAHAETCWLGPPVKLPERADPLDGYRAMFRTHDGKLRRLTPAALIDDSIEGGALMDAISPGWRADIARMLADYEREQS